MTDRLIKGVRLPSHKGVAIALTAIYGIGRSTAADICRQAGLDGNRKLSDLNDAEFAQVQALVSNYRTEGDLKDFERSRIAELVETGSFRGLRHAKRKGQSDPKCQSDLLKAKVAFKK